MSNQASSSAALPIAHVVLRILIVLNWLMAPRSSLCWSFMPNEQWIMTALQTLAFARGRAAGHGAARDRRARSCALIPLNYVVLKRLLAIVETVRAGDPFVAANAAPFAGDRLGAARAAASQHRHRRDRQGGFDPGASGPSRCRLFDQRLARRAPHVPAGPRVRGRHAHARRPRRDGLTWRSPSSSTTCSTIGG